MTFALGKYIIRILHHPSAVKKDDPGGKSRKMWLCLSREYYFCCFKKSDLHHQKLRKLKTGNQIKGNQAKYDTATQNLVRTTQSQNKLLEGKD